MKKEIDIHEVAAFLDTCGPDTKVYIGADSERFQIDGEWFADYIVAVVVHIDGRHGCKIFGAVQREREVVEVGLAEDGGDQGHDEGVDERLHHEGECRREHECNGDLQQAVGEGERLEVVPEALRAIHVGCLRG